MASVEKTRNNKCWRGCEEKEILVVCLFLLHWVFIPVLMLFLVDCGSYSLLQSRDFSLRWLFLLWSTGSRCLRSALWHMGLVAPRHVGSSWTRDQIPAMNSGFLTTGLPGKSREKGTLVHCCWKCKLAQTLWKIYQYACSQKSKTRMWSLSCDPAILLNIDFYS